MRKHGVYVLIHQYSFFSVPITAVGGDRDGEKRKYILRFTNLGLTPKARDVSPLRGWLFGAAMSIFKNTQTRVPKRFLRKPPAR